MHTHLARPHRRRGAAALALTAALVTSATALPATADTAETPGSTAGTDEFTGDTLDSDLWSIHGHDEDAVRVRDGHLEIDAQAGDLYGTQNNARNLVLQPVPDGAWEISTKVEAPLEVAFQQAGLVLFHDMDTYAAAALSARDDGVGRMYFLAETRGAVRNDAVDRIDRPLAEWPNPYHLRLTSDGQEITASWSADGERWNQYGRSVPASRFDGARVGLFAYKGNRDVETITARFDYVRVVDLGAGVQPEPPTLRGTVTPIDWSRFDKAPSSPAAERLETILTNANRYALTTWYETKGFADQTGPHLDLGGVSEHDVRPVAAQAFGLAAALGTGTYDAAATGVSEADARATTTRLVSSLAHVHVVNDPNGWSGPQVGQRGGQAGWQSALWAAMTSFAGWLVWDDLTPEQQTEVQAMTEYEADRFLTYDVPYWKDADGTENFAGDTKAEENSWNSMLLQVATAMIPDHPHWEAWTEKNLELLISAHARPSDVGADTEYHGKPLAEWIDGWNVEENGLAYNHGIVHPDYMATAVQNLHAGLTAGLAGMPTPQAALHNVDLLYSALVDLEFDAPPYQEPGGTMYIRGTDAVYYPQGTSWGDARRMHVATFDAMAADFGMDRLASIGAASWEDLHAGAALAMQERFDDGRTYGGDDVDPYAGREEWVSMHAGWAHLSRWLTDRGAVVVSNAPAAELREMPDTTAPELTVTLTGNPNRSGKLLGPVTVTATATDDRPGAVTIEYRHAGDEQWDVYTDPLRFTRAGRYVLELRATDAAGNVSDVEEVAFSRPGHR